MSTAPFVEADYKRIIELYDTDGASFIETLSDASQDIDKVVHCEFELLRQGGLGGGSLTLDLAVDDTLPEVGQWIVCKYDSTTAWYRGRVESVDVNSPDGAVTCRLYSLWSILTETQVGGNPWWDTNAQTVATLDYFTNDPDRANQIFTTINNLQELVEFLYNNYIAPWGTGTVIQLDLIDAPLTDDSFRSMTFRGGESLSQIIRTAAELAGDACYGIDADNKFFFKQNPAFTAVTYTEGVDCNVKWTTDRSLMFNRLVLTGGYVYGAGNNPGYYVWNYHAEDADSVAAYGVSKTLTVKIPWIRNHVDSQNFADSFFAKYAVPTTRYTVETIAQGALLQPWSGTVNVNNASNVLLVSAYTDQVSVKFDEAPAFSFTTGPSEPKYPGSDVKEPKNGEDSSGSAGGGGDAGNVSGFTSVILPGISIDSCFWPPCEFKTMAFYVTSAYPTSGYVVGDAYFMTQPICPRTSITVWDIDTPFGQFVALDGLSGGEVVGRMGTATFMRRYADHDVDGCKWFLTGLSCP